MFGKKTRREKALEDMILHLNAVIREDQEKMREYRSEIADLQAENDRIKSEKEDLSVQLGNITKRDIAWGNLMNFDGTRQVSTDGDEIG